MLGFAAFKRARLRIAAVGATPRRLNIARAARRGGQAREGG